MRDDATTHVSATLHPLNYDFLMGESARTGETVSELVNDAVTLLRRLQSGGPVLGGARR